MLLLSTDTAEDLSLRNDDRVSFSTELPPLAEQTLLAHPYQWFVGSRNGCSCGFRHLHVNSVELGFGEPEDWFPEEPEDIDATLRLIGIVRELMAKGAKVDCIDAWGHSSDSACLAGTIDIDLLNMNDRAFRLFENHRFVFFAKIVP